MQVPHDAMVLVADGRKMLLLRNEGDAEFPNLQVEKKELHPNPKDSDQKTDQSGQSSSTQSGQAGQFAPGRGTMGETDFHQLEEDRFAAETAALLNKRALANQFESLIIVAPPKTLGELRKHYHKEVESRLVGEIGKDLTDHTVPQIEQALLRAE
jgi:protein required for attachment to host cells